MNRTLNALLPGACLALAALTAWTAPARAEWRYSTSESKWVHTKSHDVDTEISDNQLGYAVAALGRGDAQQSVRIVQGWLRVYRDRRDCQSALFLLGQARQALGHYDDAYEAYEQLLDGYAGTELFEHVLGLQTEMAQAYLEGRKRRALKVLWVTAYDEGEQMLERVFQRDPRGASGKKALSMLADYHYRQNRFDEAQDEYQRLAANFPNDPEAGEFKRLAGQAALGRFRGVGTDARALDEAELQFRRLAQEHPQPEQRRQVEQVLRGIDERRAEKDFQIGEFYRRTEKTRSAIYYYRCVVRDYPDTVWGAQAQQRLVELGAAPQSPPSGPPIVTAVGVGLTPPGPDGESGEPGRSGEQPGPPVVHWAGPVPRVRSVDELDVIDIGPTITDNLPAASVRQMGDVAGPTTPDPESNP